MHARYFLVYIFCLCLLGCNSKKNDAPIHSKDSTLVELFFITNGFSVELEDDDNQSVRLLFNGDKIKIEPRHADISEFKFLISGDNMYVQYIITEKPLMPLKTFWCQSFHIVFVKRNGRFIVRKLLFDEIVEIHMEE